MRTILLILVCSLSAVCFAESKTPLDQAVFHGEVKLVSGFLNTYVYPVMGDRIDIDLRSLDKLESTLKFKSGGVIPLSAKLQVYKKLTYTTGAVRALRLMSGGNTPAEGIVRIDIQEQGAFSPPQARMWIVVEGEDGVWGVVYLEGEYGSK